MSDGFNCKSAEVSGVEYVQPIKESDWPDVLLGPVMLID